MKTMAQIWAWTLGVTLLIVVATGILGAFDLVTIPWRLSYQTSAFRASPAYVETKQNLLIKLMADYERTEITAAHKAEIIRRMKAERALLPDEHVPPRVSAFLAGK